MPLSPIAPIFGSSASIFYYGIVRYLYNRSYTIVIMSQIILDAKFTRPALVQDILFSRKKSVLISSANLVECDICGKGIEDGFSITAKPISNETVFFCDFHYN